METIDAVRTVPRPITVGPEMAALWRFYPDVTWIGDIVEGGMGPGTPAMTAHGCGIHESIQDGRWIVGTYQQDQHTPDGTLVLTWQLQWVVGWDPARREYCATMADNYGQADVLRGRIDSDRLTFETVTDGPVRLRLTWDASDPRALVWTNESSVEGRPWTLIETYHMRPIQFENW